MKQLWLITFSQQHEQKKDEDEDVNDDKHRDAIEDVYN